MYLRVRIPLELSPQPGRRELRAGPGLHQGVRLRHRVREPRARDVPRARRIDHRPRHWQRLVRRGAGRSEPGARGDRRHLPRLSRPRLHRWSSDPAHLVQPRQRVCLDPPAGQRLHHGRDPVDDEPRARRDHHGAHRHQGQQGRDRVARPHHLGAVERPHRVGLADHDQLRRPGHAHDHHHRRRRPGAGERRTSPRPMVLTATTLS